MRDEIINKAYEIAVAEDIEKITFVRLSDLLNFNRRSFYRIFESREEVLFEVYKLIIDDLLKEAHELNCCALTGTVISDFEISMTNMLKVFLCNQNKINYINKYNSILNKSKQTLEKESTFYRKCDFTQQVLEVASKQGLLVPDLDAYKLSCIILENSIGLVSRYHTLQYQSNESYMNVDDIYLLVKLYKSYIF